MSDISVGAAYVFVNLPNSIEPILCGAVLISDNGTIIFGYAESYLKNPKAFALDPIHLPLKDSELGFAGGNDSAIPSAIRDALPDSWGRFLIEKRLGLTKLSEIDYALNYGGNGVGSIDFSRTKNFEDKVPYAQGIHSLEELMNTIDKIESGYPVSDNSLFNLFTFGSSIGGAKPKAVIEIDDSLWLAKFGRVNDVFNQPRLEYANMLLAKHCGINIPEVRLEHIGRQDVFLIKRFDREKDKKSGKYMKNHFLSALTVTGRHELESQKSSYQEIASGIRVISKDIEKDLIELYKRMIFNIICNNNDDHLRNHGFLMTEHNYQLSPAYDIVPSITSSYTKYLHLNIGLEGKVANFENALSDTAPFGLSKKQAQEIITQIVDKAKDWKKIYSNAGINEQDIITLEKCFTILI